MFVRITRYAIIISPEADAAVLLLKDERSDTALPIGIDPLRGKMISDLMKRVPRKRPGTYDLIGKVLSECGARLKRVAINDRTKGFYSALLTIEAHGKVMELDSRPVDALALAICERVPIYIAERLLSVGYVIRIKLGEEDPFEKWLRNLDTDLFKYKM